MSKWLKCFYTYCCCITSDGHKIRNKCNAFCSWWTFRSKIRICLFDNVFVKLAKSCLACVLQEAPIIYWNLITFYHVTVFVCAISFITFPRFITLKFIEGLKLKQSLNVLSNIVNYNPMNAIPSQHYMQRLFVLW